MRRWGWRRGLALPALAASLLGGCAHAPPTLDEQVYLDPTNPEVRLLELGRARLRRGDEDAREACAKARRLARDATQAALFDYLAARLAPDRAGREQQLAALDLAPLGWRAYAPLLDRGDLALARGDGEAARAYYRQARAFAGQRAPPRLALREALLAEPAPSRARLARLVEAHDRAQAALPDAFAAQAALRLGDPGRAVSIGESARRLGLGDSLTERALAFAYAARRREGDLERARVACERAFRLGGPGAVEASLYLPLLRRHLAARLYRPDRLTDLEAKGIWAATQLPNAPEPRAIAAWVALERGELARAAALAAPAIAPAAAGAAARRVRVAALFAAGSVRDAYALWLDGVPARALFRGDSARQPALERLRRIAASRHAPRLSLARALCDAGLSDAARAVLATDGAAPGDEPPDDPDATARTDLRRDLALVRAVDRALSGLPKATSVEAAAEALARAAWAAGLGATPLPVVEDEAGTLVSADHPLCRRLLTLGIAVEVRRTQGGLVARALTVLAASPVAAGSSRAYLVTGRGPLALGEEGGELLGRTARDGRALYVYLDTLAGALPAEPPFDLAPLYTRLSGAVRLPGSSEADLRAQLLAARCDYVLAHETGHARDLLALRGLSDRAAASLARAWAARFSPDGVRARYEELAELYALARCRVPAVALVSLARAAGARGPHARAARAVLGALTEEPTDHTAQAHTLARVPDPELRRRAVARLREIGEAELAAAAARQPGDGR